MILPPHDLGPTTIQSAPPVEDWWLRLLEIAGAGLLGFVSALISNRSRFQKLETLIAAEKEKRESHERHIETTLAEIKSLIRDGKDNAAVNDQRGMNETRQALNAIRNDNNTHHAENKERLRIMREQIFAIARMIARVARSIPGMNGAEVDDMMGKLVALEVERAD